LALDFLPPQKFDKGKAVLFQAMKEYGGLDVEFHTFLSSKLCTDEWCTCISRPNHFNPGKRTTRAQWLLLLLLKKRN